VVRISEFFLITLKEADRAVSQRRRWALLALLLGTGCLAALVRLEFNREHSPGRLEAVEVGTMTPVHSCGELLLAGQPAPEDLKLLKERGVKTIISVRHADEIDWDEAAAAATYDMTFIHVPFQGEAELTDDVFDKVLSALRNKENGPTVFHCGSANRVGAIWYAHRVLNEGVAPEVAEQEAKAVGLRNPAYLKKSQDYVKDHVNAD
jgi:protein tyrosine phosphatase (PTP) superfamily phosphohydrolase (DUF442 family)